MVDRQDNDARQIAPATRGRPFQPGNPGRPEGSRNRASIILDAMADSEAGEVLRVVVNAAKAGDLKAAEILLSRAWPARKGRGVRLNIPPVSTAADVVTAISAVVEAASQGEITPDEAATLANVLELKRKAIETADLEQRIIALEQAKR